MTTYPLTFPSVTPASSSFMLANATSSSTSPFTFTQQVYKHQGARWQGSIVWPVMTRTQASAIKAFLIELQGQYGTFLYGDPDYLAKGAVGIASGSGQVAGAGQTGNSLNVDNLSVGVTGLLKKGDYFQIGTGLSSRLYCLTEDVNSDSGGAATLYFYPALRSSPADNAAIVISGAKGLFRSASNVAEWQSGEANLHNISFSFVEAINE
jgi:hypothetical protein